jgi:hypothetical protein
LDASFRLYYCKDDLPAADSLPARLQELEAEATEVPVTEGTAPLGAPSQEDDAKEVATVAEVSSGFAQGIFPINVTVERHCANSRRSRVRDPMRRIIFINLPYPRATLDPGV